MGEMRRALCLSLAAAAAAIAAVAAAPALASASSGFWTFVSAPGLHPPKLEVLERKPGLAQGDFLVANLGDNAARGPRLVGQPGPMILDSQTRPVWFLNAANVEAYQQETYQGRQVLVMVRGSRVVVLNEHYRTIATVRGHKPWLIDGHDASIVGGDVWVTVIRIVKHQNLTAYGGMADGTVIDCGLQEYRLSSGRLIRTWDVLNPRGKPNVPLSASETKVMKINGRHGRRRPTVFDAYHLNAVQALPDGDLLVSMRDTWAVYLLDPATNRILWTLGGRRSTFTLGQGARFRWQHDARLVDPADGGMGRDVEMTLFDDNNGHPSAGLVLRLNTTTHRATLQAAYHHHPALDAEVLGSMQLLPNGNALVGWGSANYFSEYSRSGEQLLNVAWPGVVDQSYRALFTDTWVGTPYYLPRGAVRGRTVYASWNGATLVSRWEVTAGSSSGPLKVVASHRRTGFETAVKLGGTYARYEVRALSAAGRVLGTSRAFS
jgi:hypothetical protein